jgi:hypothetical protein
MHMGEKKRMFRYPTPERDPRTGKHKFITLYLIKYFMLTAGYVRAAP